MGTQWPAPTCFCRYLFPAIMDCPFTLWENEPFLPTGAFGASFHRHEERFLLKYSEARLNMKGEGNSHTFSTSETEVKQVRLEGHCDCMRMVVRFRTQKWNCGCQRPGQGCLSLFTTSPLKAESVWKGWWCLHTQQWEYISRCWAGHQKVAKTVNFSSLYFTINKHT